MERLWDRLERLTNLWIVGVGALLVAGLIGLVPYLLGAMALAAFPELFGPGLWSNVWFLLAAAVCAPLCLAMALRLIYGFVPDAIDRRPNPMSAGYAREREAVAVEPAP